MDMKYNDAILQQNIPEFVNLFISTNFCDDFGYSKLWNKEVERWLFFIKQKDNQFFKQNVKRIRREKQRDELLGEYKSAYFIESKLKGKILKFEPFGKNRHKLDFSFRDKDGLEWFAEVKSPSWRNEVVQEVEWQSLENLNKKIEPFQVIKLDTYQSSSCTRHNPFQSWRSHPATTSHYRWPRRYKTKYYMEMVSTPAPTTSPPLS